MKCFMRREARRELTDATDYYESAREGLGDEFLEDFLLAITEIEEAPPAMAGSRAGGSSLPLVTFPVRDLLPRFDSKRRYPRRCPPRSA